MTTKKTRADAATQREEARRSLMDMLADPKPMNNVAAVGADMTADPSPVPQAEVVQPQVVVGEVTEQPELVAQTAVKDEVVTTAQVASQQDQVKAVAKDVQPQQVAEPAQVAQAVEPAPAQSQPVQESAPVSDAPQNPLATMAAMLTGMMETGGLNPEFLKECNVSTPLDPRRAQLLKLAGMFTKKSQKAIMTEALDMWLKSHGFVQPPQ